MCKCNPFLFFFFKEKYLYHIYTSNQLWLKRPKIDGKYQRIDCWWQVRLHSNVWLLPQWLATLTTTIEKWIYRTTWNCLFIIDLYACVCSNANWYDQSHNHNYLRLQQQSNESMHTSNLNQIIEFLKCRQYHPIKSNEMLHLNSIFSSIYFELLIYEFFLYLV